MPTIEFLGLTWANQNLGKPESADPHKALAQSVGAEYREAIEGGDALFNRVTVAGLSGNPFVYTHTLIGCEDWSGRRAVLSCLAV